MQVFGAIKATMGQTFSASKPVPVDIEHSLLHGESLEQFKSKKYTFESVNALVPNCTSLEDGVEKLARCYERILNRLAYMSHYHPQLEGNQTILINISLGGKRTAFVIRQEVVFSNSKITCGFASPTNDNEKEKKTVIINNPVEKKDTSLTKLCKKFVDPGRLMLEVGDNFLTGFKLLYLQEMVNLGLIIKDSLAYNLVEAATVEEINDQLASMRIISNLPEKVAEVVAMNRDIAHIPGAIDPQAKKNREANLMVLETPGSAIRLAGPTNNPYTGAGNQVSILHSTTFMDGPKAQEKPVRIFVVSVPGVALDDVEAVMLFINNPTSTFQSVKRPEMSTYLKVHPELLAAFSKSGNTIDYRAGLMFQKEPYGTSQEALDKHVLLASDKCNPKRVVLSAVGMGAFLSALETIDAAYGTEYKEQAMNSKARRDAMEIAELRAEGIPVVFSDVYDEPANNAANTSSSSSASSSNSSSTAVAGKFRSQAYLDLLNKYLKEMGEPELQSVDGKNSALGGGWAMHGDLFVNAWDSDSGEGNGVDGDNTFDGQLARRALLHFVHMVAIKVYQQKMNHKS